MRTFDGKVAAITGAGSGIGRALALDLAGRGCHLALCDVNGPSLDETVAAATAKGVRVSHAQVDVSDRAAVFAWADAAAAEHGAVNLIVNNAGVAISGTVADMRVEDYEWIMAINFWGVVYGTKAFLPHLEASGDGHVVNISSVFGLTSQPLMSGYNASKFAVRGFTESLRQDLELTGSCVSATCVHPGGIRTNIARAARQVPGTEKVTGLTHEASSREAEKAFITTPERAAQIILRAVQRRSRRVLVGPDALLFDVAARVAPAGYQRLFTSVMRSRARRT
jgi:short-subunit dehydrogenase